MERFYKLEKQQKEMDQSKKSKIFSNLHISMLKSKFSSHWGIISVISSVALNMKKVRSKNQSSWHNRLARSTVNREVVGSIPTEDVLFYSDCMATICFYMYLGRY